MEQNENTKFGRKDGLVRAVTVCLDTIMIACFLLVTIVVITGGWQGSVFQIKIDAHQPEKIGILLLVVLFIRKLVDWSTPVSEMPLMHFIREVLLRISRHTERWAHLGLTILICGYATVMGIIVCLKHLNLQSQTYDLGIYGHLFWSAANDFGFRSSIIGGHFFGYHFSPILYLFLPGYCLWSDPIYLLLIQTIALSLGAVPLYLLASGELKSRNWGLLFAFLFLTYQPMRNTNLYDFHEIAFVTPLLMLAFLLLHKKKYIGFVFVLFAALACKEEISEIVFIFGIYIMLVHKKRMFGVALAASGIAIFFALILLVIPYFKDGPYFYVCRYSYLGKDIPTILTTLATRPFYVLSHVITLEKLEYIWNVFGPVGFLSFTSLSQLLLAVPTLVQNLLSDAPSMYSISFQYTSPITPFVFISAVFGTRKILFRNLPIKQSISGVPRSIKSLPILLLLLSLTLSGKSPGWYLREYNISPYSRYIRHCVLRLIPPQASVSAQDPFLTHLSQRETLYHFSDVKGAEYVMLDSRTKRWFLPEDDAYFKRIREMIRVRYTVIFSDGSLLLLKRNQHASDGRDELPKEFIAKRRPKYAEDTVGQSD